MKTTRYFEEQVLRKRSYLKREWCEWAISHPLKREVQDDGRVRYWGEVVEAPGAAPRFLRVVTPEGGDTIHNAFSDRGFRKKDPR